MKNKVLMHATIWMNPENIMVSQRSQEQDTTYCVFMYMK